MDGPIFKAILLHLVLEMGRGEVAPEVDWLYICTFYKHTVKHLIVSFGYFQVFKRTLEYKL